jgi:hypothetical protein
MGIGLGHGQRAELGRCRLAQDDESGAPQTRDHQVVSRRDEPRERSRAHAKKRPSHCIQVLDADRDAVKARSGRGLFSIRFARRSQGLVGQDLHEGIELRVDGFDTPQIDLGKLDRRKRLRAHQGSLFDRRLAEDFDVAHGPTLDPSHRAVERRSLLPIDEPLRFAYWPKLSYGAPSETSARRASPR